LLIKREHGIRNIKISGKNVQFAKGEKFQNSKSYAKSEQDRFQKEGHLTRIFPARVPIKKKGKNIGSSKGYYVWYSKEKIRKSNEHLAISIIGLNWAIRYSERELKQPSYGYGKYDPKKRRAGIREQKQKLRKLVNQYEEQLGKRESNKLKKEIIDRYGKNTPINRLK